MTTRIAIILRGRPRVGGTPLLPLTADCSLVYGKNLETGELAERLEAMEEVLKGRRTG